LVCLVSAGLGGCLGAGRGGGGVFENWTVERVTIVARIACSCRGNSVGVGVLVCDVRVSGVVGVCW
jgi:hypothetical protein